MLLLLSYEDPDNIPLWFNMALIWFGQLDFVFGVGVKGKGNFFAGLATGDGTLGGVWW